MTSSFASSLLVSGAIAAGLLAGSAPAHACACAPRAGEPVVNADQSVILVWDPATKTEHFIRRASFKAEAHDFGFLVPTPSKPDLAESGDAAFDTLAKITAPEIIHEARPSEGCSGCMRTKSAPVSAAAAAAPESVTVLEEKAVAGFQASVLEATSAGALVGWLKERGYAFSPEVEAWAKPYVEQGWKITALRVASNAAGNAVGTEADGGAPAPTTPTTIGAASLRLSFKTDRPLFPYREPDSTKDAPRLAATSRMLRIFFVSTERYDGALGQETPWVARAAWSNDLPATERDQLAAQLGLPPGSHPAKWRLTEYEHAWPYRVAPGDLYFAPSKDQRTVKRQPIVQYSANGLGGGDAIVMGLVLVPFVRRRKDPAGRTARGER